MYAITDSSYRTIGVGEDLLQGETAVDTLPQALLHVLGGVERRFERDVRLRACDWTQADDSPLSVAQKAAWASYRQALRSLPDHPDWPECPWPEFPGLPDGAASHNT